MVTWHAMENTVSVKTGGREKAKESEKRENFWSEISVKGLAFSGGNVLTFVGK